MSPDNGVPAAPSTGGGSPLPGEGAPPVAGEKLRLPGEGAPPVAGKRVRLPGDGAPAPGDDLALVAARFGAALRAAGVPADPGRCERFAGAVTVARPVTVSGLYLCALATLVASKDHIETLRRVFEAIFGGLPDVPVTRSEPPVPGGPEAAQGSPPAADLLREAARAAQSHPIRPAIGQQDPATGGDENSSGDEPLL